MRQKVVFFLAWLVLGVQGVAWGQTRILTGRVTDSLNQEPLTSGQVAVVGMTIGTSIKDDGTFTLVAPVRDVVLTFRSIGFKRREIAVPASQNAIAVGLERDYFQLEAIVVTGQATGVERRNLANAVASVSADQLVKMPATGIEQTLIGKLSGANINFNTNAPGGGARIRLRGVNSLTGGRDPLYVIDGVIASDASIASGTGAITSGGTNNPSNRIADLNPNDIENVEVLKGAAASAIYGSKASTGVILITTKRGRVGAPQFNVTQRVGMFQLSKKVGLRRFTSVADAVDAKGPVAATYYQDAYFDHEEELFGNEALGYETIANANGGTENTQYFISGLLKRDGGIVTNTYAGKQSMRLNLDQAVGSRLKIGVNSQIVRTESARGLFNNDNAGVGYGLTIPHIPSFFDLRQKPDGTWPQNPFIASNPLETAAKLENVELVWRSILSGNVSLDLIRSSSHALKLGAIGGLDFFAQKNRVYSPPDLQYEDDDGLVGTSSIANTDNLNQNVNLNLVHTLRPGGSFTATTSAGVQWEWRDQDNIVTLARNLLGGLTGVGAGTVSTITESRSRVRDEGMFVQEEVLTLGEKLLLTAGVRADRSSNNALPTKWYYFPKGSASYRFGAIGGLFDDLKLRAAVGQSGNQPTLNQRYTVLSSSNIAGILATSLGASTGAPDLRPERQLEVEGGLDATLWKGRANLEFTFYQKKITDLLLGRSLATSTGFSTERFNGGALRTRGFEASLNVVPVQGKTVQWSSRINFTMSRSLVTDLPVPSYQNGSNLTGFTRIEAGLSPTLIYGFDTLGGATAQLVPFGQKDPSFQIGASNDLAVRGVRLYFLWDWKKGGLSSDGAMRHFDVSLNAERSCDERVGVVNECVGKMRNRVFYGSRSTQPYVRDNSWLKLREVSLSYDLPRGMLNRIWSGARSVRFSVAGRNLLTFSPWWGYDPEGIESGGDTSPVRELGAYPPSRSFWFSIDLGF